MSAARTTSHSRSHVEPQAVIPTLQGAFSAPAQPEGPPPTQRNKHLPNDHRFCCASRQPSAPPTACSVDIPRTARTRRPAAALRHAARGQAGRRVSASRYAGTTERATHGVRTPGKRRQRLRAARVSAKVSARGAGERAAGGLTVRAALHARVVERVVVQRHAGGRPCGARGRRCESVRS